MNTSNCTEDFHNIEESTISMAFKVTALLLLGGLGAVGNIFFIILAVKYTAWKNLHHLLINMTVADTLVAFMKMCLGVMKVFRSNYWDYFQGIFARIICKMLPFFNNVFVYESLVTLLVITVERFRVTRLTVQRSRLYTLKQRAIVLACCWLISMVLAAYHLVYRKFESRVNSMSCLSNRCDYGNSEWNVVLITWIFVRSVLVIISLCIIFILSIITLRRLSKPQAIQDHLSESQRQARTKRTRCAIRMVLCSLLLYTCCYLPHLFTNMILPGFKRPLTSLNNYTIYFITSFLLPVVNSFLSPCIYIAFLTDFREAARRLLGRLTSQRVNRKVTCFPQPHTAEQTLEDDDQEFKTTSM